MGERIGIEPSFDPFNITNLLVRGFVYSAYHYALDQKAPAKAVKEFSNDLGSMEPATFEKKYGVPSARFRHQLRRKDPDCVFKETRLQLKYLAEDFSEAEGYWGAIFSRVIKKYFKNRSNALASAIENSRWYPYLEVSQENTARAFKTRVEDIEHLSGYYTTYVSPTDKKEKRRFLRLTGEERLKKKGQEIRHPYGWIFLRENFCSIGGRRCLLVENIQQPKLISNPKIEIKRLPSEVLEVLNEIEGEDVVDLRNKVRDLQLSISTAESIKDVSRVLFRYEDLIKMLEDGKKSGKIECALKKWWHGLEKELKKATLLYSPQSFHALDFLPALLANIYFMEKYHGAEMDGTDAVVLDTENVDSSKILGIGGGYPKEREDYRKLVDLLGAERAGKHLYLARFSR